MKLNVTNVLIIHLIKEDVSFQFTMKGEIEMLADVHFESRVIKQCLRAMELDILIPEDVRQSCSQLIEKCDIISNLMCELIETKQLERNVLNLKI